ncbi:hypothetical protein GAYE_SCF26G4531 [Galdieria yellowstonensis]|uniref:CN hydrolase domain-containing protein n=1 Tax=Galdieria yellowstonensis TaxID=3028027 RepID=A0AAV9IGM0_9RHOD|nr:hypothetical protein GAYE_SCF26G4531 [Galdieria yellowstonensis]
MSFRCISFLSSPSGYLVISTFKRASLWQRTQLDRNCKSYLRNFSTALAYRFVHMSSPQDSASMNNFNIALCQILSTDNKEANIAKAVEAIEKAARKGAKLVVLPECFNSPYDNAAFPVYAEEIPEPGEHVSEKFKTCFALSEAAKKYQVYLVGGSIPERDGSKLYNSSPVFSPSGELLAKHRKVHLFDVDVPGGIRFFESDSLSPGNRITVVKTELGNIGVAICYDIRFPELSMAMAREGACIICLPAAFNMTTGPAHWELLMRSRALDNQLYVAACGPARNENASYQAWGHSMLASPWGDVVVSTEFQEDLLVAEVKKELVQKTRMSIPLSKQRRSDLYEFKYSLKAI